MHPNLLDQLDVFRTVAETGSLSAAARRFNRAVSAVSYAIDRLEEQLGLALFERSGQRLRLSEAGRELLREAVGMIDRAERLQARAAALARDEESHLQIMIDMQFPPDAVARAVTAVHARYPNTRLLMHRAGLTRVWTEIERGWPDIAIAAPREMLPTRYEFRHMATMPVVMVTGPTHPLARLGGPVPLSELQNHCQLMFSTLDETRPERRVGAYATEVWEAGDLQLARELLMAGHGWGTLTLPLAEADIAAGRLVRLDCPDFPRGVAWQFCAIWRADHAPGPCGHAFVEELGRIGRSYEAHQPP